MKQPSEKTRTPNVAGAPGRQSNIYKLLGGVLLSILLVGAGPYVAAHFGLLGPLADKAWLILFFTGAGLVFKCLVNDTVAGEFMFHKFGYENCVMMFGATLTALGLQLASEADLFPGLSSFALVAMLPTVLPGPGANRSFQLFVFFVVALVFTLLTAKISRAIKQEKAKGANFLALLNTLIGLLLLAFYVLILITKG
jgi:hypothetical protein